MPASYQVGDRLVHAAQGVADVVGVESIEVGGTNPAFCVVRHRSSGQRIRVPSAHARSVGLRALTSDEGLPVVISALRAPTPSFDDPDWHRRLQYHLQRVLTGTVAGLAATVRDLHLVEGRRGLSLGEQALRAWVLPLLVEELALLWDLTEGQTLAQLEQLMIRATPST